MGEDGGTYWNWRFMLYQVFGSALFSGGGKKPWLLGQGLAHLWPKIKCRHKGHWVNSFLGHFLIVKSPIIKGLFGTLTAFWLLWKLHFVFQLWTILASGQSAKGSWWPLYVHALKHGMEVGWDWIMCDLFTWVGRVRMGWRYFVSRHEVVSIIIR